MNDPLNTEEGMAAWATGQARCSPCDSPASGQVCLAASGEPVNPDAKVEERPLVTPRWGDAPKIKDGRRFFAPARGPSSAGRAPLGVHNPYSDPVRPGLWAACLQASGSGSLRSRA